ncbi:hypothetical protein [Denitrobaculum tricleocarpae]|uniref:Uncharacterized protein n=1 Tax=Denitrobaculum tricleocarpae TaxID=2591009 RepID=A0A545TMM0_9PROT|nr:hypothetical protein [Denitrobaculum tricleocarpae]TQV78482.1 hypothetical protein FKG95_18140 [Denitrobaculum tricleocarpae]
MNEVESAEHQWGGRNLIGGGVGAGPALTLKQLLYKLEDHFPTLLSGEGSLRSEREMWSDRLLSTFDGAYLETLGPPGAISGLLYSYDPGPESETRKKRIWAGTLLRNALPRWRGGKTWVRRALLRLEENRHAECVQKQVEGHSLTVEYDPGSDALGPRLVMRIMPPVAAKPPPISLGVSCDELLNGLRGVFSKQEEPWPREAFHVPHAEFRPRNSSASLSVFSARDEVTQIAYVYPLSDEVKSELEQNRRYALELVRNTFPHWPEASEWLRNAIVRMELEQGYADTKVLRRGLCLQVVHHQGDIVISVIPEGILF